MSYSVSINDDHLYVLYYGIVDTLDIVQITADEGFIPHLRRLQKVVHDFSYCAEVNITMEDMREIILLANLESNFTEKLIGIIIPRSEEGYERVKVLARGLKSRSWTAVAAENYAIALQILGRYAY